MRTIYSPFGYPVEVSEVRAEVLLKRGFTEKKPRKTPTKKAPEKAEEAPDDRQEDAEDAGLVD
jgi:hypothetical protein